MENKQTILYNKWNTLPFTLYSGPDTERAGLGLQLIDKAPDWSWADVK